MAQLVRVYLYVRQFPINREGLERLGQTAERVAHLTAGENFDVPVEINLDLEEGSLKVVGFVIGTLFSTYYFVGNYKAFKEGVVEVCNDANKFGGEFCDRFPRTFRECFQSDTSARRTNVLVVSDKTLATPLGLTAKITVQTFLGTTNESPDLNHDVHII